MKFALKDAKGVRMCVCVLDCWLIIAVDSQHRHTQTINNSKIQKFTLSFQHELIQHSKLSFYSHKSHGGTKFYRLQPFAVRIIYELFDLNLVFFFSDFFFFLLLFGTSLKGNQVCKWEKTNNKWNSIKWTMNMNIS